MYYTKVLFFSILIKIDKLFYLLFGSLSKAQTNVVVFSLRQLAHDEYQADLSACTQIPLMCANPGGISQTGSNGKMGAEVGRRNELLLEEALTVLLAGDRRTREGKRRKLEEDG